ncbi:MAG: ADOP family duplicated permease, partial [Longimicrobiales bacterium]
MGWKGRIRRRSGPFPFGGDVEGEIDEELRFHIAEYVEDLMRRGHSEEEARRRALREFGDVTEARAELVEIDRRRARRAGRSDLLLDVRQDVRFAMRTMLRRPAFAVAAALMLALGIGATTAIFSVVDAALLRPLPFEDPDRLAVILGVAGPERDVRGASYPEIRDWEQLTRSFSDVSIYDEASVNMSGEGEAERLQAEFVSPGYFRLLGVSPRLGRGFTEDDDRPGVAPSVIISHSLWQRRFGAAPDILGRNIMVDDRQAVIVGVMPEGFRGFSFDTEVWATLLPFAPDAADDRGNRWLAALARLGPGVSAGAAQADLRSAARQLEERYPNANRDRSAGLFSLHQYYLDSTRTLLIALVTAVGFLLLIACLNVINLQLVRGIGRSGEVALRHALGAGKLRLVRQLMTEAGVLAVLGGAAGVVLAYWGTASLGAVVPEGLLPAYVEPSIDGRVLLFAAGIIVFTGVVSGIVPALRSTRRGFARELRAPDRGASAGREGAGRLQRTLVAVEVTLAVALMAGAALMVRSLTEQLAVEPGFRPVQVLAARVNLTSDRYTPEVRLGFVQRVIEQLEVTPGVAAVAVGSDAPLRGINSASVLVLEGRPEERVRYYRHRVTPGYFEALGIPLAGGRGFDPSDDMDAPRVAMVSEAFAEKLWPGRDPIGQQIQIGPDGDFEDRARVIGVVGNVRFRDLTTDLMGPAADPDVYFSYAQDPTGSFDILVRSALSDLTGVDVVRRAVVALDPSVPLAVVQPLEEAPRAQTANARFGSLVLGIFAVLA